MSENQRLTELAQKVNENWRVDRHTDAIGDGPDGLLYELEVWTLEGEGSYIEWFQQYAGSPELDAEHRVEQWLNSLIEDANCKEKQHA
tara:strand:+ start:952 stop:1215 length:264 start_codon:yes stop_codon:yes gene_type:complete